MPVEEIVRACPPEPTLTQTSQRLFQDVSPAVVMVRTERGSGTGFFIDADGHVLTANHVVSGATRIECIAGDGSRLAMRVCALDSDNDLALLRGSRTVGVPLRLGESLPLHSGEQLYSVTHQLGSPRPILGSGRYTHHGLMPAGTYRLWSEPLTRAGSSGGPIVQADGSVVSLTSAGDERVTASIPAETVAEFLAASDPRFQLIHRPSGILSDHVQLLADRPALALLDSCLVGGAAGASYLFARRLPRSAIGLGAIAATALGYNDYQSWMHARNEAESRKFGLATILDLGMLCGLGLATIRGRPGVATFGVSAMGRLAAEFYPTRTILRIQQSEHRHPCAP